MDFLQEYKQKLVSADEAVKLIQSRGLGRLRLVHKYRRYAG